MRLLFTLVLLAAAGCAQNSNTVTIIPKTDLSETGQLRFRDLGTTPHSITFQAAGAMSADLHYRWPAVDGVGCFGSNGSGVLSIVPCAAAANMVTTDTIQTITGAKTFGDVILSHGYAITGTSGGMRPEAGVSGGLYAGYETGTSWIVGHDGGAGAVLKVGVENSTATMSTYRLITQSGVTGTIMDVAATSITLATPDTYASGNLNVASNFKIGGTTVIDSSRNATFASLNVGSCSGCAPADMATTDTTQSITGTKTLADVILSHGFSITGISGGMRPGAGVSGGLYAGYETGTSWLIGHDGGAGAVLKVGVENSTATMSTYRLITQSGVTGTIMDVAATSITLATPDTYASGNLNVASNFKIGGTTVIDSSRNATFAGLNVGSCSGCVPADMATTDTTQAITGTKTFSDVTLSHGYVITGISGGMRPGSGVSAGLYAGYETGTSWLIGHDGGAGAVLNVGVENSTATMSTYRRITQSGVTGTIMDVAATSITLATPDVYASGNLNIASNVKIGGTTVVDSSRNATFAAVASSSSVTVGTSLVSTNGSLSTYGTLTVSGSKNGWTGVNFRQGGAHDNVGTLMALWDGSTAQSGFYNAADSSWDWLWTNGTLAAGGVPAARIQAGTLAGSYTIGGNLTGSGGTLSGFNTITTGSLTATSGSVTGLSSLSTSGFNATTGSIGNLTVTGTCTGCGGNVAGGFTITGNAGGPNPGYGYSNGLYGGVSSSSAWLLAHDGIGSGNTLMVGAQNSVGDNNSYLWFSSTGWSMLTATQYFTMASPTITAAGNFAFNGVLSAGSTNQPTVSSGWSVMSGSNNSRGGITSNYTQPNPTLYFAGSPAYSSAPWCFAMMPGISGIATPPISRATSSVQFGYNVTGATNATIYYFCIQ